MSPRSLVELPAELLEEALAALFARVFLLLVVNPRNVHRQVSVLGEHLQSKITVQLN